MRHPDALAAALLERFAVAAIAVATDGSVLLANEAAAAMLGRGEMLFRDSDGRLQLRCARSQRQLLEALSDQSGQSWSFLAGPRDGTELCLVSVAALDVGGSAGPARLVRMVPMSGMLQLDTGLLQSLFGLSPAEAKVASCLGSGQDIAGFADAAGVQPATVRAQLKAVFRKMAINRQQELVRIATLLGLYCR